MPATRWSRDADRPDKMRKPGSNAGLLFIEMLTDRGLVVVVKIGDVVEIPTKLGLSYAHYTHRHAQYVDLLRVFSGSHVARPSNLHQIVEARPAFMCFFPLGAAVRKKIFSIAANVAVPSSGQTFPVFRAGALNPATGKVGTWWLWDGEKEWPIGGLTAEQRSLSIRGVWNDTYLINRIESGWTPETDPT